MSREKWLQFVVGVLLGLFILNCIPDSKDCTKLAAIVGGCK